MSKTNANDGERYSITAKGVLQLLMADTRDINQVWQRLRDFVELQAMRDGHPSDVLALVFEGGDVCLTMAKVADKEVAK